MTSASLKNGAKTPKTGNNMTNITSKTISIPVHSSRIYQFISDFNNLEKLMPEKVTNWSSTSDSCSFTIQGMATLNMKQGNNKENELVHMKADGKNPFHYDLNTHIQSVDENSTKVYIELNADMNPMVAMMAKKPLGNFVNILVETLAKQF
jgi:carbon monoxide dehydrogenase subunit G